MTLCRLLAWDSEFFGKTVARVEAASLREGDMAAVDAWCRKESVDCLYLLADPDDRETTRLAGLHGFRLVDLRVTLQLKTPTRPSGPREPGSIRVARESDLPKLMEIARGAHTDSRFFADPGFPDALCAGLYAKWIENSCRGYADAVLVADVDGRPAGYATCHLGRGQDTASIGLLGVAAEARGMRLGSALVEEAVAWMSAGGSSQIEVVTQGRNVAAQSLYQACGFRSHSIGLWYHRWSSDF